jgi:hypothetical protein
MIAEPAMVSEGRRICELAAAQGIAVRLLGGTAIWLRSPKEVRALLTRDFADLDLVTARKDARPLRELLEQQGYVPDKMFNATQGTRRLYFTAADGSFHVDIFVDSFVMSHTLDLAARLDTEPVVLPAAELLLTKLQIAELNQKDAADTVMLLLGHELGDSDSTVRLNATHVVAVCAQNWGLYTTVTDNLGKIDELLPSIVTEPTTQAIAHDRIRELLQLLDAAPKSRGWKRRARIGRRIRWYETPDEV